MREFCQASEIRSARPLSPRCRGLARRSRQNVEHMLVEDAELDRLVAAGDRVGQPVRLRRRSDLAR